MLINKGALLPTDYLWVWFAPIMTLCYIKAVFLDSIVVFGEAPFYSGKYKVFYKSITDFKVINETVTLSDKILLVKIYNNDKLLGFDKFFIEDYFLLRKKVLTNLLTL